MNISRSVLASLVKSTWRNPLSTTGDSQRSRRYRTVLALGLVLTLATGLGVAGFATSALPARAAQVNQIIIRAEGKAGTEQMELIVNGETIADWIVGSTAADYVYTPTETMQVDTLEVRFVNDSGVQRDLVVDYVDIGGTLLQSEDSSTRSTGTFLTGAGCAGRASISQTLHCNGSFVYSVPQSTTVVTSPPTVDEVAIVVRALATTGSEQITVQINGAELSNESLSAGWQTLSYSWPADVPITSADVMFTNDSGLRDVRVDYLEIDEIRYESEDDNTYGTGHYLNGSCGEGFGSSEWLYCNGGFSYAISGAPTALPQEPDVVPDTPDDLDPSAPTTTPSTMAPSTTSTTSTSSSSTSTSTTTSTTTTTQAPDEELTRFVGDPSARYSIAQVIDGTISAGDGSNPNEESPMGRHDAPLSLNQGWNWAQGPSRNSVWGQLGSGGSQYAEFRCAVIPESGHTPPVPFRINVREGAYYQFANGDWQTGFNVDLTGGNHGGYLGTAGNTNSNPFNSGSHGLIEWRREADGSYSAPWNASALMMHFWAAQREAPASGQTAEFLTSEVRLQQPDGQTVDLSQVKVLFQCGVDYYSTTGGQGTSVPGPGIGKYHRATEEWKPSLWVTLPSNVPANSVSDFTDWLQANTPPNVG